MTSIRCAAWNSSPSRFVRKGGHTHTHPSSARHTPSRSARDAILEVRHVEPVVMSCNVIMPCHVMSCHVMSHRAITSKSVMSSPSSSNAAGSSLPLAFTPPLTPPPPPHDGVMLGDALRWLKREAMLLCHGHHSSPRDGLRFVVSNDPRSPGVPQWLSSRDQTWSRRNVT